MYIASIILEVLLLSLSLLASSTGFTVFALVMLVLLLCAWKRSKNPKPQPDAKTEKTEQL